MKRFPLKMLALVVAWALAFALAPAVARAQDNMLRGPHPFLNDNEVEAYILLAEGLSDSPSGAKLALDYDYKLALPLWLVMQLNLQLSSCHSSPGSMFCGPDTGQAFETLAGAGWKWSFPVPVVAFVKGTTGLVFVFPNAAHAAVGFMGRASAGATYYFFDWLGLGAQLGFSLGHVAYDSTFPGSHTYGVFDFGGGIQFQF